MGPLVACIYTTNINPALHKSLDNCPGIAGDTQHARKSTKWRLSTTYAPEYVLPTRRTYTRPSLKP